MVGRRNADESSWADAPASRSRSCSASLPANESSHRTTQAWTGPIGLSLHTRGWLMLKLEHVSRVYRTTEVETAALDNLSLEVRRSGSLAIMGPCRSGKATPLKIPGLIDSPTSGSSWLLGEDVSRCMEATLTL